VLSTGMSGTGKSTLLDEPARRGHWSIDTDEPGWIVETMTADGPEPLWDLDRVRALLDEHRSGWLLVAGCVADQGALHDRFDEVVLLSAPVDASWPESPAGPIRSDRRRRIAPRSLATWRRSSRCSVPARTRKS
jgi:hypothetical protein